MPEEKTAHDKRKEERRAARAKAVESESAIVDDTPLADYHPMSILKRMSRRQSVSRPNQSKEEDDKRPKLLEMKKGESVVKNNFIATDEPHTREIVKRSSKPPSGDRSAPPADPDKPNAEDRRHSSHRHSRSSRQEGDRERHRTEEEREARRIRKEKERAAAKAEEQVAAEAREQQKVDEERRRVRREERRKRREAEERDAEIAGERERERERRRSHRRSKEPEQSRGKERARQQEKEKDKSAFRSLLSFGKKVFS
jgi:hypothetical protein